MHRRLLLASVAFFCAGICLPAQNVTYRSELLAKLAARSGCQLVGCLGSGPVDTVGTCYGLPVKVEHVGDQVFNLGVALFDPDMTGDMPEVYGFIERYFLELLTNDETDIRWKLKDDNVAFMQGTPYDVTKVTSDSAFSLSRVGDSFYDASWMLDSGRQIVMRFPLKYELILGIPQIEIEKTVDSDLKKASILLPEMKVPDCITLDGQIFQADPCNTYMLDNVNDRTYYVKDEQGVMFPLFSDNFKLCSLANLFQGRIGIDYQVEVMQSLYGFKKKTYTTSVNRWLNFCKDSGTDMFFSVESEDTLNYIVMLVCVNRDLGYNHLVSMVVPKDFVTNHNAVFKMKLNAYIPTHNIKNLYGD